jgi:hypothetical protein
MRDVWGVVRPLHEAETKQWQKGRQNEYFKRKKKPAISALNKF